MRLRNLFSGAPGNGVHSVRATVPDGGTVGLLMFSKSSSARLQKRG
jgi:hypothetical protein